MTVRTMIRHTNRSCSNTRGRANRNTQHFQVVGRWQGWHCRHIKWDQRPLMIISKANQLQSLQQCGTVLQQFRYSYY